jgi:Mce-associated membrane protein
VTDLAPEAAARLTLSRAARTAVIALSVVVVLLAGACVALAVTVSSNVRDRDALRDAREAAVAAARQEIVNLDSISYSTVDADMKRVLAGATGTFKTQFSRAQADLKSAFIAKKSVSTGTVLFAGIVRGDMNSATVLVAADRTVKDSSTTQGAVAHDRWSVDLEKHGGRWLVATLEPVA